MVEYLISENVKLNSTNNYGQTPLAIATILRRVKIADMIKAAETFY